MQYIIEKATILGEDMTMTNASEIIPAVVMSALERYDLAVSGWEKSLGRYTFELEGWTDAGGDMTHSLYVDERDVSSVKAWYKAFYDVWDAFSPWEEAHKWCDGNGVPQGTPFDDGYMLYEDLRNYMDDTLGEALDDLHVLAFGTRKF